MGYQNISCMFFRFVTKHAGDVRKDKRMDRQNYDPQDLASVAASCGKNMINVEKVSGLTR